MLFEKYKWGQGKNTRLCTALAGGVIAAIGCWRLYEMLQLADFSEKIRLWVGTVVPLAVFGIIAWFLYWIVNKPSIADFMISAEGELKKVSFASRREIVVSTFVVITVVVLMSVLLGAADISFITFFSKVVGI